MNFEIYTTPLNTLLAPTLWYDSLLIIYTVGPSYLWVPHLQIQATIDQKYSEKNSGMFPKA